MSGTLNEPAGPNRAIRRKNARSRKSSIPTEPAPGTLALTVCETAWELRVSVNMVWNLLTEGKLPSFTIGRRRLVARSSIEHFVAQGGTGVR